MSKKSHILMALISMFILFGCTDDETKPAPKNLISQEHMIAVLTDICKIEARFQRRLGTTGNNNSDLVYHNYNLIFDAHNIELSEFKTSYEYYQESPQQMQELYDSVIVHLTKEQSVLEEIEPGIPKMK